ncbi:hypothetical protein Pst134EA_022583 [Puccinia striiformis f. sp. tritici]|uniref:hypothetical protein n=1 Tax=Puccinia striiformis f. sp. tritici TaxID=168172 RepID=UPI002007B9BB|nr:hypothetical protein Pst134EA_022583 [Puccinia striiformis f. sp. tritici]KAH9455107.1 hypothetical protein Pst134EA_022583 [Puccinia striiformis f. sp. tritici]
MAFYHQVEGFFVLASLHPKGPIFKQGGSSFGNRFLDMIESKSQNGTDAPAQFHTWVAAQAIQIENSCQPTEIKQWRVRSVGNINDQFLAMANNVHEICIQLKDMIRISSRYKLSCAWPGENCNNQLKEMKPSLEIDKNQWSLIPTDIMIPLEKLKGGLNQTVLACLSLNEIHLTYHPDWQAPPSKIEHPDKRKHSSKRTPKPNSSTHPAPNASNSTALDSTAAAPNASNSTALDHASTAPNTFNSNASDCNTASPNASNLTALDHASAAPNTSNLNAFDCTPAAPNTSNSGSPKKRKHPAPKTSNLSGLARTAAAPNASNMIPFDQASAARKACDSLFAKRATAARNTPNLNNLDGVAADRPDSNNNNTDVSGSPNDEGSTSLGREPAFGCTWLWFCLFLKVATLHKTKYYPINQLPILSY